MRTLTTLLAPSAIRVVLLAGAVVALAVELLPYVVLGIVIGPVIPRRRQRSRVGRAPVPSGGAVHVPVLAGPPPQRTMPVTEAELVRDPRHG
jgi:hypothetical protein